MTISQGMTYALAGALLVLSVRSVVAPRAAAVAYGVPLPEGIEPTPYLEVKANRDFVLAGLLVTVAYAGPFVLTYALFVGTIAPFADALTVERHGQHSATAIHLGTAAFMIVAGTLAALGR